jgi:hypothetical protein
MRKYRAVLKSHRAAHACHYITWERQPSKTVDALDFFVEHLSAYERRLNLGKVSAAGHGAQNLQQSMKGAVAVALSERLTSYAAHHFLAKAARLNYLDPGLFDQEVRVPRACSRPGWGLQARKRKRESGADIAPQQHIKRDAASIEGRALR